MISQTISTDLLIRFGINIISVLILVRFVYYKYYKKSDLFLSFFGFNLVIFLISFLLNKVNMTMGAAFGLFAVFSILRIRTEGINTKDMTYLFMAISIGLISAVSVGSWVELMFINIIIVVAVILIDGGLLMKKEVSQIVEYDNLDLLSPERRPELYADVQRRTGLKIHRIETVSIDFLKDSATFYVFYYL
jgi:hypothetical protein